MSKTHYRKVFKSDHLGVADLEDELETGSKLIYTIKQVRQEQNAKVAGKKINANIAYFVEPIKPLVLNATNSKVMRQLTNSCFVEDWSNVTVQLYIDKTAKLKGEVVGGVRINPNFQKQAKPQLTPANQVKWEQAKAAFLRDGNFNAVLERMDVSEKHLEQLMQEANNV